MSKLFFYLSIVLISILTFSSCIKDEVENEIPVANAGSNQTVEEGVIVSLDGTESSDIDNNELTYLWTSPEGITLSSTTIAQPTFTAPNVIEDTQFTFTLAVSDELLNINEAEVIITVIQINNAYVVNYGNYGDGGASISKFNYENNTIRNNYYQNQNDGFELLSNIQYAYEFKDSIYLMGNNSDEVIIVNPLFQQSKNGITTDIAKPRYCVGEGNYLYISCWGEAPDWTNMPDTYIAKFNVTTNTVEQKIALPGGPEGLAIANGNLYAALNYVDSVAVISLSNNALSYIATPAVSSYFLKDENDNLFVSLVSTYSNPSNETGLGYINTAKNTFEEVFKLDGVSSDYGSIISANSDFSKIYVLATQYDENWNLSGSVYVFDLTSGTFSEFITGISGPKGVTVNPVDNKIYLYIGESVTAGGLMKIYAKDGTLEEEIATGISPTMALFLD